MVRPGEVDYHKCERLSAVVAHNSKGDRQGDPPKRDGLFAWDHSVERVWATLELLTSKPLPLRGVKVHEVEAAAPVHEGLSELGHPDLWVDNEGKPPRLRDAIRVT
jgi:hypothetical protein